MTSLRQLVQGGAGRASPRPRDLPLPSQLLSSTSSVSSKSSSVVVGHRQRFSFREDALLSEAVQKASTKKDAKVLAMNVLSHRPKTSVVARLKSLGLLKSFDNNFNKNTASTASSVSLAEVPEKKVFKGIQDWSNVHSKALVEAVEAFGFKWTLVASDPLLSGWRTEFLLNQYWTAVNHATKNDPPPSKKWTPELDALLTEKVSKLWGKSSRPWTDLADTKEFSMFTPMQLYYRWTTVADPLVKSVGTASSTGFGWGIEEDRALLEECAKQGPGRIRYHRIHHPLLTCYGTAHLRVRHHALTSNRVWTPEEDARIQAFNTETKGIRNRWVKLAQEFGDGIRPRQLFERSLELRATKFKTGAFSKEEDDLIVATVKECCGGFDLRVYKKQGNGGRDLYDVIASDGFSTGIWAMIGGKLSRDPRNVETRAFQIWRNKKESVFPEEGFVELEEYLDMLGRGLKPEWSKLSHRFKFPSRNISSLAAARYSFWNSTADRYLMDVVTQVLDEAVVKTKAGSKLRLDHSELPVPQLVPSALLENVCLSKKVKPLDPPPDSQAPYEKLPEGQVSARELLQLAERNLNLRIDYAFVRAGIYMKGIQDVPSVSETVSDSIPTVSPLDTVQPGDDAVSVGGLTTKRTNAFSDFYTMFSHLIPWEIVSTRLNQKLEVVVFAGRSYNSMPQDRMKDENGEWFVRRLPSGRKSYGGPYAIKFRGERCRRRWISLVKERLWNTDKW